MAADDTARLLVSIEATQKRFEKQLASIAKAAGQTAKGIEDNFKGANDNVGKSFEGAGRRSTASVRQSAAAVSNLSFQLNDIAMGLASGTSPFTIMVQQGSQVAQALQGSGGLLGAVKTLGGAFATMVNPVSLASFAIIGLSGALVQYLTTLNSGVPDSEKLLKDHGDVIKSFDEAWGIAEQGVKKYSDAVGQIELQKLKDKFGDLQTAIETTGDGLSREIITGLRGLTNTGGTQALADFTDALQLLNKDIPDFRGLALALAEIENQKGAPGNIRELAKQIRLTAQESIPLQDAIEQTQKKLDTLYLSGEQAKKMFASLTASALGLGASGGGAISIVADKIKTELIPAMGQALSQVGEYAKNLNGLQAQINKSPLGQLAPLYSGGGKFLNWDENNTFKANESTLQAAGESAAAQMIRGFEGFISTAKWDVNAFRTGFGSDTATRANGQIEKVTKDTVVTLEDAQRDLSRRIIEFQSGIQKAIGIETWKSLNEAQQAALTSIAYNYGSLPDSIVRAIQEGGGAEKVSNAIAALSSNPSRRKEEAQAFLSGTGISSSESTKRTPADLFKGDVQQVQARIDALNAEYAAQARLNPLVNDYGYAVEKARIEQELLSEAQRAGLEITPGLREQIAGLAENYARASTASEQLKTSQQNVADAARQFSGLGKEVVGGFISDLRSGASAAEALSNALNKVLDKIIDIGLESLFSGSLFGGGGGGGLLGGMIIPGILHKGGVAGSDGYGHGRSVSPSAFTGAKRYHKGGVAGLQPGEVPAILQRGEVVLPRGTKMGGQQGVAVQVGVTVDDDGKLQAYVKKTSQEQVATAAPKILSAANQQAPSAVARHQQQKGGAEWR
ncbi:phage tail length tape measure family protein [Rhizobium mongolense]|uniref:Lysozyme n=1 Tax=Rhizobium mongolense TaxID=57676 RepID=A0A7W6WCR1_9HYPH|nr:phage tail length tape measure family protein [Rhizobium mongolense]MBB4272794.1 GH24 family phage-related lysozyme (muramidase) [Rhizobium mongolense]